MNSATWLLQNLATGIWCVRSTHQSGCKVFILKDMLRAHSGRREIQKQTVNFAINTFDLQIN
jgi:hypothetical protein